MHELSKYVNTRDQFMSIYFYKAAQVNTTFINLVQSQVSIQQ